MKITITNLDNLNSCFSRQKREQIRIKNLGDVDI